MDFFQKVNVGECSNARNVHMKSKQRFSFIKPQQ